MQILMSRILTHVCYTDIPVPTFQQCQVLDTGLSPKRNSCKYVYLCLNNTPTILGTASHERLCSHSTHICPTGTFGTTIVAMCPAAWSCSLVAKKYWLLLEKEIIHQSFSWWRTSYKGLVNKTRVTCHPGTFIGFRSCQQTYACKKIKTPWFYF